MPPTEKPDAHDAATLDDLDRLNLRIGTVRAVRRNAHARTPAYVLDVDFGPLGVLTTSAQLTARYTPEAFVGRRVVCALGFPPKRVAGVVSACLVLAAVADVGDAVLLTLDPVHDAAVPDGTRVA